MLVPQVYIYLRNICETLGHLIEVIIDKYVAFLSVINTQDTLVTCLPGIYTPRFLSSLHDFKVPLNFSCTSNIFYIISSIQHM